MKKRRRAEIRERPKSDVIRAVPERELRRLLNQAYDLETMPIPKSKRPICGAEPYEGFVCQRPVVWDYSKHKLGTRCERHGGRPHLSKRR